MTNNYFKVSPVLQGAVAAHVFPFDDRDSDSTRIAWGNADIMRATFEQEVPLIGGVRRKITIWREPSTWLLPSVPRPKLIGT